VISGHSYPSSWQEFALACFNREQYDIPAGKQQHQPCVIRLFVSEASVGITEYRTANSDVHSHQVKTEINITHIRGVLWKKYTSVGNRQRLQVISLHPGVWRSIRATLGLTMVPSGGQVVTPRSFPMLVIERRWSFLKTKNSGPPDRINKRCRTSEWV
jgi:hypothetical protein